MKNVKAELIDLLDEITNPEVQIISFGLRQKAIELLKSINFEAQIETPNVNNNEAQEKKCHYYDRCNNSGKNQYCYDHKDNDVICYK